MNNNSFKNPAEGENAGLNKPLQNETPNAEKSGSKEVSGTVGTAVINAAKFSRRVKTDAFDKIAMVLNFFLTFWFVKSALFGAQWKVCASYVGIFALATAFIFAKQKRFNVQAALSGVLCVLLSFSFALRDNPSELCFWAILILIYLSVSYCLALTGANRHGRGSLFFLLDILKTQLLLPFKHFFLPYACMHNTRLGKRKSATTEDKKQSRGYKAAVIGIVCAVPVLLIVVPLLVKSDAAFESVAGSVTDSIGRFFSKIFGNQTLSDFIDGNLFAFVPTVFVAPYIFSVMFSFRHGVSNEDNKDTSKNYTKLRVGSPALFSGFLGVICLVYVIYLLSQTAYFFSAFGGKLPGGTEISLAQYARRGFFELAGIAAVNLVLIAVTVIFSRRENGDFNAVIKAFDIFLCVFNILLSAISMSKIVLYMNEMGLTHKRIYVFLIDIVLIVTFLCVMVRLLNRSFPYMRVITAAVCVLFTALSLVGVDLIVAEYNADKYLKGELSGQSVSQVLDGNSNATLESCLKIAESDTRLKYDALASVQSWGFVLSNGKVEFDEDNNSRFLSIDARRALKAANEHIDTVREAIENYGTKFDENGAVEEDITFKFYMTDNTSVELKSMSLTLYSDATGECETLNLQNADGSMLKKNEEFGFGFENKNVVVGDFHTLEIAVTDADGQIYSGEFTEYFTNGTHIYLVSSGETVIAVCDELGSVVKLEK